MIGSTNLLMAGDNGYNLTRSLRFRASASAYLSRTPASAGNRQKWTWSGWVKRGTLSNAINMIFTAGTWTLSTQLISIAFTGDDKLRINAGTYGITTDFDALTTAVFRDPSAWYHIVVAFDSAQATASNRLIAYVSNVSYSLSASPTLNYSTAINNTVGHRFGNHPLGEPFDGYLAEVNFIDGQALTPSSFGSTNSTTGVWQPAAYTGTYGTNGFYLPFTDNSALTTSSNVGLGKDFSGNGNYWTTNNISITAGVTYDSMTDVPTLTSATAANFAVLNPLYTASLNSGTISNGNLDIACLSGGGTSAAHASVHSTTGKYYFEVTSTSNGGYGQAGLGIQSIVSGTFIKYTGASGDTGYTSYGVYGVAYDVDAGKMWIKDTSGAWTSGDPVTGTSPLYTFSANSETYPIAASSRSSGSNNPGLSSHNFGQRPFTYTPPSGFVALNTYNLPDSTIKQGNKVMDATVWGGNDASPRAITNSSSFKPDLVWVKNRTTSGYWNVLFDSVRGAGNQLSSNQTDAELASGSNVAGKVSAFNSDGFSLLAGSSGIRSVNGSGESFVGWQWQAGQGATSTNTDGNVTSTVSVNASAGFSVVTYTVTTTPSMTIGHGLGVAPKLIIEKRRDGAANWDVYTESTGNTGRLLLNSTAAFDVQAGVWNNTSPTSTVFSQQGNGSWHAVGSTCVAYCWAEIPGFSKFGSYTGNGSADGPFVYLGFKPRFLMTKRTDSAFGGDWYMYDSVRDTYNLMTDMVYANSSAAESSVGAFDALSNGFKIRSSAANFNASGGTYIYAAFAENPFKYALAR